MNSQGNLIRNNKRIQCFYAYLQIRNKVQTLLTMQPDNYYYQKNFQKLPRNSIINRIKNRCGKTGRSRGYFRFFGLCRLSLRSEYSLGHLPGLMKHSW